MASKGLLLLQPNQEKHRRSRQYGPAGERTGDSADEVGQASELRREGDRMQDAGDQERPHEQMDMETRFAERLERRNQ